MNEKILQAINNRFESDYHFVEQFESGIANFNYLLVNSDQNKIVARILREQPKENIPLEYELQKELIKNSIVTPVFICDDSEPVVLEVDGQTITLTQYIESDFPGSRELKHNNQIYKEVGITLARLQKALEKFNHNIVPPNYLRPEYQDLLTFNKDDVSTSLAIKGVLKELTETFQDLKLPKALIHGDLNDGNFLLKDSKIIAVLDLETIDYTYRVLDLGAAIYYMQPNSDLTYPEISKIIISGFESISPLTEVEKQSMKLVTKYNAACFSLWSLANEKKQESYDFLKGFNELQQRIEEGF